MLIVILVVLAIVCRLLNSPSKSIVLPQEYVVKGCRRDSANFWLRSLYVSAFNSRNGLLEEFIPGCFLTVLNRGSLLNIR